MPFLIDWTPVIVVLLALLVWLYAMSQVPGLLAFAHLKGLDDMRTQVGTEFSRMTDDALAQAETDLEPDERD
jgi:hypothetical protein